MRHTGRADAPTFIEFCGRLLHDDGGPVFFIVDRHPIHTAAEVTTFAAATEGRLRLFYLPTYSPELNPDERVWKNVKHDHVGRSGITSHGDLFEKATQALERLQKLPGIVRGFFRDPHLAYTLA